MDVQDTIETLYSNLDFYKKDSVVEDFLCFNDADYNRYYQFLLNTEYLCMVGNFIENSYGLENSYYYTKYLNTHNSIIMDFSRNVIIFINDDMLLKHKELKIIKKLLVDKCLTLVSPTMLATNSLYLKSVALMLYDKYKQVEGLCYILYDFYSWGSFMVAFFSKRIESIMIEDASLSLPFSGDFLYRHLHNIYYTNSLEIQCYSEYDKTTYTVHDL